MARIRGRGNKDTELALARLLRTHGVSGWRRHLLIRATVESSKLRVERRKARGRISQPSTFNAQLTVRPDFVFRKTRTVIFVDGCFWHGCPRHGTKPKNNAAFWRKKLAGNKRRDALVTRTLRKAGWRVVRLWECALQQAVREERRQTRLLRPIQRALE